jgi:Bacterial Ig-like domain
VRIQIAPGSRMAVALVALALTACAMLPAAVQASPAQDTATASGDNLVTDDFSAVGIEVDAHSGSLGEAPGGTASFNSGGMLPISGPVDCLNVSGNTAILTISGPFAGAPFDGFVIKLVDNGGGGLDSFQYFPTFEGVPNPIDCRTGSPIYFGGPLIGRAVVSDAPSPPPTILFTSPAAGASGVARANPIVAGFDHTMDKPSAEAAFSLRRGNGAAVPGSFGWYGNAMIFAPATPLARSAAYTATVGTGAKDIVGSHLPSAKTWQFTTAPQPLIAAVVPAENATEALPNVNLVVAFDTTMDKPSAQSAFSLKRSSDGAPVPGSFGWYGNALIFDPEEDLAGGTQYTATVTTAAKEAGGHPLPSAKSWRFTTTNRPIVDLVHPADGTTGVPRGSVTVAFFNKAMDKPSTQAAFSLKLTSNGAAVAGSLGWYGTALIFKPSAALPANTLFTAALGGTARDLAGNTLANPTTWHFATAG